MDKNSLLNVKPGDIVYFYYQSESSPARNRLARVNSVNSYYVNATDLEGGSFRNFSASRAEKVELLGNKFDEVKKRSEILEELFKKSIDLPGEKLVDLLKLGDHTLRDAVYHKETDTVILKKGVEPSLEVNISENGYTLTFTNPRGKTLTLTHEEGKPGTLKTSTGEQITKPTIGDFLMWINKHFAEEPAK
jgi:hypothetical protein